MDLEFLMLGLGYLGGLLYLLAYIALTKGWMSGTGYLFHSVSVVSCIMIAASSAYSEAWPSAVLNVIFIVIGLVFLSKKALADGRLQRRKIVNAHDLTFQTKGESLEAAA